MSVVPLKQDRTTLRPAPNPQPTSRGTAAVRTVDPRSRQGYENFDRLLHALEARLTHGISPAALSAAHLDWLVHLINAPGKRLALAALAWQAQTRLALYAGRRLLGLDAEPPVAQGPGESRFWNPAWQDLPFATYAQAYLLAEDWWQAATTGLRGVTAQHERQVPSWPVSCSTCSHPPTIPAPIPRWSGARVTKPARTSTRPSLLARGPGGTDQWPQTANREIYRRPRRRRHTRRRCLPQRSDGADPVSADARIRCGPSRC